MRDAGDQGCVLVFARNILKLTSHSQTNEVTMILLEGCNESTVRVTGDVQRVATLVFFKWLSY
jgi:hypothetical protein